MIIIFNLEGSSIKQNELMKSNKTVEEFLQKRMEKIIPMIRQGIGLNDKYKWSARKNITKQLLVIFT